MKIGLFFGSFNPIHIGHTAIANYMAYSTDLDQVWLVVSPLNPLKNKSTLADAKQRIRVVKKAIGKNKKIRVSNIELSLPQPSYTIRTLQELSKRYPKNIFVLVIGSDNLAGFSKWKDYRKILSQYEIYVYPRAGSGGGPLRRHRNVVVFNAPKIDISSTYIRAQLKKGKDVGKLLP